VQCRVHRQVGIARLSKQGRASGPARGSASDAVAAAVAHLHDKAARHQGLASFQRGTRQSKRLKMTEAYVKYQATAVETHP
jgi:hypothetical protein